MIFVIGDIMLDRFVRGKSDRISPEAPVPLLDIQEENHRPGGAANVALNLTGLRMFTRLFSLTGRDSSGDLLRDGLRQEGLLDDGILQSNSRRTTVKTRIMAGDKHLLRLDFDFVEPLAAGEEAMLLSRIREAWEESPPQALVLQDYNKGVLTRSLIETLLRMAKEAGIPVAVDPKDQHFWNYTGVSLFKPNLREIRQQIPFAMALNNDDLRKASDYLISQLGCEMAVITLGDQGLWIADSRQGLRVPGVKLEFADVSGAGDAVIACLVWSLLQGHTMEKMGGLANAAGAMVCSHPGVVSLNLDAFLSAKNYFGHV